MSSDVLVFIESRGGRIKHSSLEALSEGRRAADGLSSRLHALLCGPEAARLAEGLAAQGPDTVLVTEHELLNQYHPEAFASVLAAAVRKTGSAYVLLSATALGRDLAARAAARLEAGLASDCVATEISGGGLRVKRPVFSGKAVATVRLATTPAFATLRPNAFPVAELAGRKTAVETFSAEIDPVKVRARTIEGKAAEGGEIDISEASVIVAGGRAMKGPENFALIRDLATALGGAVGASRPAVDAGWIDHQYQVGQTGKVVAPGLYVACGISGAIQHLAGMSTSKVIIAINKDPEAPIFKIADYGIVGDLYQILPKLTEEVRKLKGE